MPNQSGSVFGLTFLSPIIDDELAVPSHDLQIRKYLATLPTDTRSPFAIAAGTHLARLVVMDDVIYVGMPACEEHLKAKYLVFETNCDFDSEEYLAKLATQIPEYVDAIWKHCTGYPGVVDVPAFVTYMKRCQIDTTFFFAAVNDASVADTLTALQTQRAVADFIVEHQGVSPVLTQRDLAELMKALREMPTPPAGAMGPKRAIKTGGRNE